MSIEIKINNQFSTKQGLKIALEICRYELTSEQIDRINCFINHLDNSQNKIVLTSTQDLMFDIKNCITILKRSESIHWIRNDFVKAVLAFEKLF
jgi:hypothetical protein